MYLYTISKKTSAACLVSGLLLLLADKIAGKNSNNDSLGSLWGLAFRKSDNAGMATSGDRSNAFLAFGDIFC